MSKASDRLVLENIGPISRADVKLADLTVLVGPQASGKSLFLQFLKLVLDHRTIIQTLVEHGLDWDAGNDTSGFLDLYLGRGMSGAWKPKGGSKTWISWNGDDVALEALAAGRRPGQDQEQCFVIPAQRVLAFSPQGWLRPFSDFRAGDPYVIRAFSEHLRVQADAVFERRTRIWQLEGESYQPLLDAIFGKFELAFRTTGNQKEIVLTAGPTKKALPFMVWSAGQREFVPLLLALTWLLPATRSTRKRQQDWVFIEEPEMGLHPKAIAAVLLVLLELLGRGYRVCLSTHSTHVLDLVWALQVFRQNRTNPEALLKVFGIRRSRHFLKLAATVLAKDAAVFYFDTESGTTRDISSLDPNDANRAVNSWGGLTDFSSQVGEIIARHAAGDFAE